MKKTAKLREKASSVAKVEQKMSITHFTKAAGSG